MPTRQPLAALATLPPVLVIALLVLAAFVLGSFPTGVILARARGVDLRQVGSGNIGATNVGRALGRPFALLVLTCDAIKGYLPVWLAGRLGLPFLAWALGAVGLGAILGHSFSIFLRGRGGKSVATSLGAALAIAPLPALCAAALYVVMLALFRISSVGSLLGVWAFPAALLVLDRGPDLPAQLAFAVTTAIIVTVRHRDNIQRLIRGQELKA
jgi:acyl phosphate:glycerol-3-phosphate acyltransferase